MHMLSYEADVATNGAEGRTELLHTLEIVSLLLQLHDSCLRVQHMGEMDGNTIINRVGIGKFLLQASSGVESVHSISIP